MSTVSERCALLRVVRRMSIEDLVRLAESGTTQVREIIAFELCSRHVRYLRKYVEDTKGFMDALRATGSIVSGPFTLRYLEGTRTGPAKDMDIYTPYQSYAAMVAHMVNSGYTEYASTAAERGPSDVWARRRKAVRKGVKTVAYLCNGECKVSVVQTTSPDPVFAVVHFWTTLHMNFITADGFCSLYPSLTFQGIGLVAPIFTNGIIAPSASVIRLLQKWHLRGHKFVSRFDNSNGRIEVSERSPLTCDPLYNDPQSVSRPDTERGSGDSYCFTMTFGDDEKPYEVGTSLYRNSWRVGWNLGGRWDGKSSSSKAFTFDEITGKRVDVYEYLVDLSAEIHLDEVD